MCTPASLDLILLAHLEPPAPAKGLAVLSFSPYRARERDAA